MSSLGRKAVILSAVRTPVGAIGGALASLTSVQLGAIAGKAAIQRAGLIAEQHIQEVYLGNVCSANLGQAPATQVAHGAGCAWETPATTVNKVCASGMKATMLAAQSIQLGLQDCILVVGAESMSNVPYYVPKARYGYAYGHGELPDGLVKDGLWDFYANQHMGLCAEKCATDYGFSREQQDEFAIESCKRAMEASKNGMFDREIVPVEIVGKKGTTVVSTDESLQKIKLDKIPSLKPAFSKTGTVTAANASSLNDGASALVIASEDFAKRNGIKPLATIIGYADAAKTSVDFTTAPSLAVPKALEIAGISAKDVDYHEINEAFAVVALANAKILGASLDKVNVRGGAVALGHPIGSSGSRIIGSLVHILHDKNGEIGVASICNGGGGASAIVIKRW